VGPRASLDAGIYIPFLIIYSLYHKYATLFETNCVWIKYVTGTTD